MTNNLEPQVKKAMPANVAKKIALEQPASTSSTKAPNYSEIPYPDSNASPEVNALDVPAMAAALQSEWSRSKHSFIGQKDDLNAHLLFTRPQIIEMARQTGKKHIMLELPYYFQGIADHLWSGEKTPAEYVKSYLDIDHQYTRDTSSEHLKDTKKWAEETANIIIRAKQAGIKVGFVDPRIYQSDNLNPRPDCVDDKVRWQYQAESKRVLENLGMRGVIPNSEHIPYKDLKKAIDWLVKWEDSYKKFFELRDKQFTWQHQRLNETNPHIARLIDSRAQGEPFVALFGQGHLEIKDSIPEQLKAIKGSSYQPRVTALHPSKQVAEQYYNDEASTNLRWFRGTDFSNAPDSVLLLKGEGSKPEFYVIPPKLLQWAKEVTEDGHYADTKPLLPIEPLRGIEAASVSDPSGTFAKSLTCSAPRQSKQQSR